MRRHEFFFWLVRIPLELGIVVLAFWIARTIRISTDLIPGVHLPVRSMDTPYLLSLAVISYGIIGIIFAFQRLYAIDRMMWIIEEIFTIIKSIFVSFFVMIGLIYLTNGFPYDTILIPRLILLYAFILCLVGIIIERFIIKQLRLWGIRRKWFSAKKILLVINHAEANLENILQSDQYSDIIGYLSPFEQKSHFSYLGTIGQHAATIEKYHIEEIIVLSHDLPYEIKKSLFEYCQIYGIRYRYVGNLYETTKQNAHIDFVGRIPFIEIRTIGITSWGRVIKRLFDLVVGMSLLIVFIPFGFLISLFILLESSGSPFYSSSRVGRNNILFSMMKFRSMIKNADHLKKEMIASNERTDGPLFKIKHDPRVTKIGRFMRKWSIDELPQILNVLRGDMSFIWPRPHLPEEVARYTDRQKQVLTIKPGITGMAQVYWRDTNTFNREVELDLFYIENWSLLLDTKILLLTFRAIFQGK